MGKVLVLLSNVALLMLAGIVLWATVRRAFNALVDRKVEARLLERTRVRLDPDLCRQLREETLEKMTADELLDEVAKRQVSDLTEKA